MSGGRWGGMGGCRGFIDLRIVWPILVILGTIGYAGWTGVGLLDLPGWLLMLAAAALVLPLLLPSGGQFPNAGLGDDDRKA